MPNRTPLFASGAALLLSASLCGPTTGRGCPAVIESGRLRFSGEESEREAAIKRRDRLLWLGQDADRD